MRKVISNLVEGEGFRFTVDLVAGHVPSRDVDSSRKLSEKAGEIARLAHAYIGRRASHGDKIDFGRPYHCNAGNFSVVRVGNNCYSVATDNKAIHLVIDEAPR